MTGEKLWDEIEDFMYDYYYDRNNYCETYIDVKYSRKALCAFLDRKIEEIKKLGLEAEKEEEDGR